MISPAVCQPKADPPRQPWIFIVRNFPRRILFRKILRKSSAVGSAAHKGRNGVAVCGTLKAFTDEKVL